MWIAQISDPHVRPAGELYNGVIDTGAALAAAVDAINALVPLPDLVLLSGDVVERGEPAEYQAALAVLARLRPPLRVIPGNHDAVAAFRDAFAGHEYLSPCGPLHFVDEEAGPVRIIGFDVTVPRMHHGLADAEALNWLAAALQAAPYRPTVIMMHQPPLMTDVPYLDEYRCLGADRLARLVARFPAVERVLCGHVHRHMLARFGATLLCTAPSTATAIALRPLAGAPPHSFLEPPGFLLHHWAPGRSMVTHLVPIGAFAGPFPFA